MSAERFTRISCCLLLIAAATASHSLFAQSTIFKTRRSASSVTLPLVLGTGLEYESNADETKIDVPLMLQYSFSPVLQASVETAATRLRTKGENGSTVSGLDDVETSVEYEFLRERRTRPSLTAFGGVKWPTATKEGIGSSGNDFSAGLVATKEFDRFEVDMNAIYTLSGGDRRDLLELPIAVEVPVNHRFSIAAEVGPTFDVGKAGESNRQTEFILGGLFRATPFSTLEGGVVVRNDSSWQLIFGWQFSFAGEN